MSRAAALAPAKEMTPGEFAARHPSAVRVFEKYRIDYACGGKHPLSEVCRDAGLSYPEIERELSLASAEPCLGPDWTRVPLPELVRHIVAEYHAEQHSIFPEIRTQLALVPELSPPGAPPLLAHLRRVIEHFEADVHTHSRREEQFVFPAILDAAQSHQPLRPELRKAIQLLRHEHESAGWVFHQVRQLTANFTRPAAESYRPLYDNLKRLESRTYMHLHLENNVLFVRAAQTQAESSPSTL